MLVLSRNEGERILIGDDITIMVVRVSQGTVRLGIEAPSNLSVVREEVVLPLEQTTKSVSTVTTPTKKKTSRKSTSIQKEKTTKRK